MTRRIEAVLRAKGGATQYYIYIYRQYIHSTLTLPGLSPLDGLYPRLARSCPDPGRGGPGRHRGISTGTLPGCPTHTSYASCHARSANTHTLTPTPGDQRHRWACVCLLIEWSIDLIDRLIDLYICLFSYWLINKLVAWLIGWLPDCLIGWLPDWLPDYLIAWFFLFYLYLTMQVS